MPEPTSPDNHSKVLSDLQEYVGELEGLIDAAVDKGNTLNQIEMVDMVVIPLKVVGILIIYLKQRSIYARKRDQTN